jgi:hypothetical protein
MHCAYCGRENDERLEFCAQCGTPIAEPAHGPSAGHTTFARAYSWALCGSLAIQAACLWLCATRFMEFTHRMFFLSFCFYWLGFLAVVLTRPQPPSTWQLVYVAVGFLAWFSAAVWLVPVIYGEGG